MLLKLDSSSAIYFLQSFWTLFNLFLMDSDAKILLKYVKKIISRGNSTTSIQLDQKFSQFFFQTSCCRHIGLVLNEKKVDLFLSAILRQNKIADRGFDRVKCALPKPLSHSTQEYSLTKFLEINCEHYYFCQRPPVCKKRRNMWVSARAHDEQEYIFGSHF